MAAITYINAYLLNSTTAKFDLAKKNLFDNEKLQSQLTKELKSINNSVKVYDFSKASKYNDMLTTLQAPFKVSIKPLSMDDKDILLQAYNSSE